MCQSRSRRVARFRGEHDLARYLLPPACPGERSSCGHERRRWSYRGRDLRMEAVVIEWWNWMRKPSTKAFRGDRDEHDTAPKQVAHAQVSGVKNYITPSGLQRLIDERRFLLTRERRAVTQVVAWAASNGDRSENADYQYGKRRLREIDRRIRFLTKRIDAAEVVDPEAPRSGRAATQVFFGATVRYINAAGTERVVRI